MTAEQPVGDDVVLDDILTTPDVDPEAARAALADVPWEPGARKPDPILVAENVVRNFGGLRAVSVDHREVQRGVITATRGTAPSTGTTSTACRRTRSPTTAWCGRSSSPRRCRR